jgi:hypothetical protein
MKKKEVISDEELIDLFCRYARFQKAEFNEVKLIYTKHL